MSRLSRALTMVAAVAFVTGGAPVAAQSVQPAEPVTRSAAATAGGIQGTVIDERGGPLPGVMVSAVGARIAFSVTDGDGRYQMDALPPGIYVVRAHMAGYIASRHDLIEVVSHVQAVHSVKLRAAPHGTVFPGEAGSARPVLTAGMATPPAVSVEPADRDGAAEDGDLEVVPHDHGETAWRLRHLRRHVLKESREGYFPVAAAPDVDFLPGPGSLAGRALESSARLATTFFTELPFSGELNLLTIGALDSAEGGLAADGLSRGVAYLSIGAPAGDLGNWAVQAAMSEGDVSSWIVAGSYARGGPAAHAIDVGVSYATQEYKGGNPAALAAVSDGSRNVGTVHVYDVWRLSRWAEVSYGAHYARYDYLEKRDALSPRLGVTISPFGRTHVRTSVSQRMLAPGAEEFAPPQAAGPWLPPERTFAPLTPSGLHVERARHIEVAVERELADSYLIGVRRFSQDVDNQLVTLFGVRPGGLAADLGHYYVASAGQVTASGWGVRFSRAVAGRVRGSLDYSLVRARWAASDEAGAIASWAPAAVRVDAEDLHDLTTSVETEFPETATRVFLLYRINTGYSRGGELAAPGPDGRFDVQVQQALPFLLGSTRWEVLIAVRNLFRDPVDGGSVYDELLVVRPPTRIVGGVQVKF